MTLRGRAQRIYNEARKEAVYLLNGDDMPTKPIQDAPLFNNESAEMDDPFKDAKEVDSGDIFATLLTQPIDPEELAKKEQVLFLESGTYVWDGGKCTIRKSFNDNDINPSDLAQRAYAATKEVKYNRGRCYFRVSGIVVNKDTGAKGRFDNWTFSPDERFRRDRNGALLEPVEADMASKAYALITRFFFEKTDRKPTHDGEVIALVESGLYSMYITRGKNGNNYLNQLREL
jgi:hypothetical protein